MTNPGPQQEWSEPQGPGGPNTPGGWDGGNPGGPQGAPPKKKTGLIVGLSILGVLIIAGIVILIVSLSGDDEKSAATPTSSVQVPSSTVQLPTTTPSLAKQVVPTAQALTDAIISAYNEHDAAKVGSLSCVGSETKLKVSPTSTMAANGALTDPKLPASTAMRAPVIITQDGAQRQDALSMFYSKTTSSWCFASLIGAAEQPAGGSGSSQDVTELKELGTKAATAGAAGDNATLETLSCVSVLIKSSTPPRPGMAFTGEPTFEASERAVLSFTDSSGSFTLPAWKTDGVWCLRIKTSADGKIVRIAHLGTNQSTNQDSTKVKPAVLRTRETA